MDWHAELVPLGFCDWELVFNGFQNEKSAPQIRSRGAWVRYVVSPNLGHEYGMGIYI